MEEIHTEYFCTLYPFGLQFTFNWLPLDIEVLLACRRELHEELGIALPKDAFELIFVFLQEW